MNAKNVRRYSQILDWPEKIPETNALAYFAAEGVEGFI